MTLQNHQDQQYLQNVYLLENEIDRDFYLQHRQNWLKQLQNNFNALAQKRYMNKSLLIHWS